jgi:hypothetical protein
MTEKPKTTDETEPTNDVTNKQAESTEDITIKVFDPNISPFIESEDVDQDDTPTTGIDPLPTHEAMTLKAEVTDEPESTDNLTSAQPESTEDVTTKIFDPAINPFIEGEEVGAEDDNLDDSPIQKSGSGKFILGIIAVIVIGAGAYVVIQQKTTNTDSKATEALTTNTREDAVAPESTTHTGTVSETVEKLSSEIIPTAEVVKKEAITGSEESTNVIATPPSGETALKATSTIEGAPQAMTPEASGTDESEARATEGSASDEIVDKTPEPAAVATETIDTSKASPNAPEQAPEVIKDELIERATPEEITTTAPKPATAIDSIAEPIQVPETTAKAMTEETKGARIEESPDSMPSF